MSPCPGASRPDSHSQLPEGLQGRHMGHCPGSQGRLNTRRLSGLDHLRLKFEGPLHLTSHILFLIDAQEAGEEDASGTEAVRKPNKDWANIGPKT